MKKIFILITLCFFTSNASEFYYTEIREKLLEDKIAFAHFKSLGISHCMDNLLGTKDILFLEHANLYNELSAFARLLKLKSITQYFTKYEKRYKTTDKNILRTSSITYCNNLYGNSKSIELFNQIVSDKQAYYSKGDDISWGDSAQDKLDYLNMGKIDYKRLVDTPIKIEDKLKHDNNAFFQFKYLGLVYCLDDKSKNYFNKEYNFLLDSMSAFPRIINKKILIDTFERNKIKISKKGVDCSAFYTGSLARTSYVSLVSNYSNYYSGDSTPNYIGDTYQNILDYINLEKIDYKRFQKNWTSKYPLEKKDKAGE